MAVKVAVLALLLAASPAGAADWNCSNRNLAEIRCRAGSCEIVDEQDGFTQMELSISDARVELCAYSACSPGRVTLRRTAGTYTLYHASLRGRTEGPVAIILDAADRTALMRWSGFANVMTCVRAATAPRGR